MKKSISVILVAALMLIAFTACEQQPINMPGSASDYEVAKVTVASIDTSVKAMYEGDTNWSGVGTVNIVYKSGRTVDGVTATIVIPNVLAGTSVGYASVAASVSTDQETPSVTAIDAYPVTVSGYAILRTGIEVVDTITDEDLTVSKDGYATWNPQGTLEGLAKKITSVKYTFADGTTSSSVSDYTFEYDSDEKAEITKVVLTAGSFTEEWPMDITPAEEKATAWEIYYDGKVYSANDNPIEVTWGDTKASLLSKISIMGTFGTEKREIPASDYAIYGLPAVFNQKSGAGDQATAVKSYTLTVESKVDMTGITFTTTTATVTVDDPVDWSTFTSLAWVDGYAPKVGDSINVRDNLKAVTGMKKMSGDSISTVTVTVVTPKEYYETDYSEKDTVTVTFNVTAEGETRQTSLVSPALKAKV